jgi:hypothetical protein
MKIVCNIVQLSDLRPRDGDGLTNVLMAQPAFPPCRTEERGYGPSKDDLKKVEGFVDECIAALVTAKREHNLVIFPEAFVPNSRIRSLIDFVGSNCPKNTVIVAGVESLPVHHVLESKVLPLLIEKTIDLFSG